MKSSILFTSVSGDIHTVGIIYKERFFIHKNVLAMTIAILSFIHKEHGLFVLCFKELLLLFRGWVYVCFANQSCFFTFYQNNGGVL